MGEESPLSFDITECKGVGERTAAILRKVGITTIGDLLYYFPRTHLDRRKVISIKEVLPSFSAVLRGKIIRIRAFRPSRNLHITQCTIEDDTGSIDAVWFNQRYMQRELRAGMEVIFSGDISNRRGTVQLENPDVEVVSDNVSDSIHTRGLVPVYPLTEGIGQKRIRRLVRAGLDHFLEGLPENLPSRIIRSESLVSRKAALSDYHFPRSTEDLDMAKRRIILEEFLALQLSIQETAVSHYEAGITHNASPVLSRPFRLGLPFSLTAAQERAIDAISGEMEAPSQMNVLLQGDVGSGKTIVAICAMLKALENGRQAILMAPTEILAEQHLRSIREMLKLVVPNADADCMLLTGNCPAPQRELTLKVLESGEPAVVIGTHALIQKKVTMRNAGLIIIDEQHRFGVNQRAALRTKGSDADLMIMTATPIPRTLAIALYGNFKTVLIDEQPPGRHPVDTRHVPDSERKEIHNLIRSEVGKGRLVFVVCPEIGNDRQAEGHTVANVNNMYRKYKKALPEIPIGLLHGRMEAERREEIIERFRRGDTRILVATTIIEVGVDIPDATVMVVEDACRFGLAQLHQLRGRVGRAKYKSYCLLAGEPATPDGMERLRIIASMNDGFGIAEEDLSMRGPGEFLGSAQSGVPPLRLGHLLRDADLLDRARRIATRTLENDPCLSSAENEPLRFLLEKKRPRTVEL